MQATPAASQTFTPYASASTVSLLPESVFSRVVIWLMSHNGWDNQKTGDCTLRAAAALLLLVLAGLQFATAAPPTTPASVPFGDGADPQARGSARMVGNILEYTKWPTPPPVVGLCIVGAARHGSQLGNITLSNGTSVSSYFLAAETDFLPETCNALYLGNLDLEAMRRWTGIARGTPVVTIAENDPDCRSEAMFCLVFLPEAMAFTLNIDAVSRSSVRIDPRVLRMSRRGAD